MQQVGTGPDIWWRADQPPTPRPILKVPTSHCSHPHRPWPQPVRSFWALLAATALCATALLALSSAERRAGLLAQIDRVAERTGLGLQQITLTGHRFTADGEIFDAVDPGQARTLLTFDVKAAQSRIEQLPWVERASIERIVPDRVVVRVAERAPFAVWRLGKRHLLIDRTGRVLQAILAAAMPGLPRVAGEGAAGEAAALFALLAAHPQIARQIELAERVGERRWTLRLAGGTTIHLPADDEAAALARLDPLVKAGLGAMSDIDLRVATHILVRERRDGGGKAERGPQTQPPAGRI